VTEKKEIAFKIGARKTSFGWYEIKEKFPPKLFVNVSIIAKDVKPEATHYTALISIEGFKKLVAVRNIPVVK
jgi:hypothetical protein